MIRPPQTGRWHHGSAPRSRSPFARSLVQAAPLALAAGHAPEVEGRSGRRIVRARSAHVQQLVSRRDPVRSRFARIETGVFGAVATPTGRAMRRAVPSPPGTADGGAGTPTRVRGRRDRACRGRPPTRARSRSAGLRPCGRSWQNSLLLACAKTATGTAGMAGFCGDALPRGRRRSRAPARQEVQSLIDPSRCASAA